MAVEPMWTPGEGTSLWQNTRTVWSDQLPSPVNSPDEDDRPIGTPPTQFANGAIGAGGAGYSRGRYRSPDTQ